MGRIRFSLKSLVQSLCTMLRLIQMPVWYDIDTNALLRRRHGEVSTVVLCHSLSGERAEKEYLGMQRLLFHSFPDVTRKM